jgi:hypothetical protein
VLFRLRPAAVQGGGHAGGNIVLLKPFATTIGQLICTQIVDRGRPLLATTLLLLLLLICARVQRQAGGGAWGWLVVRVGCARTPSLISVHDPGWLRVGDMMVGGVFRDAVRPLCL